jgi:hypothetical protein
MSDSFIENADAPIGDPLTFAGIRPHGMDGSKGTKKALLKIHSSIK